MTYKFFETALGGTRFIVMIGGIVFKIPYYKCIKQGRRQNEKEWIDRKKSSYLARLYFSFPFGLLNIMERVIPLAQPLSSIESDCVKDYFRNKKLSKDELEFILEDATLENFGVKDEKIVKLDWGGYGKSVNI